MRWAGFLFWYLCCIYWDWYIVGCAVGGIRVLISVFYQMTLIHYRMCGGWGVLPGRREVGLGLSGEAVCGQPVRQGILPLCHSKTTRLQPLQFIKFSNLPDTNLFIILQFSSGTIYIWVFTTSKTNWYTFINDKTDKVVCQNHTCTRNRKIAITRLHTM